MIDLPNLCCSKVVSITQQSSHKSLKDYGDFAEENKQYDINGSEHDTTQLKDVKS